ncbi:zeta toxin family protein [Mucilaginibacter jinjuensis]|uniref:Zeta toxin family protein n=1 Tax=Mucilaginibacter jinjuensis TaxID=1176721 RepID=A0ABY7T7G8_9SPHI|nr:zeta toxin family protein [Mucilaginibacter jinjuensis]WCT12296.1 zeta toxin family protein [Mucilaginibacter jinjuensis]
MNPQLLIIGGPNGAGKSTFSKDLSPEGALIYDADIVKARISAKFPDLPDESIYYAIEQDYLDNIDAILKLRQHFTVETNFRDAGLLSTVTRFKEASYDTTLVYMCLRSVEQSMDRVNRRVRNGGHFVDNNSISYNFNKGLKNLEYFANRFDNIEVIDVSNDVLHIKSLLSVQDKQLIYYDENSPDWTKNYLQNIARQYTKPDLDRDQDEDRYRGPRR